MPAQDYLIGGLAVALGLAAVWHALAAQERLMQLAKFRVLSDALGPQGARWVVAALGVALVAVGILVASGYRFPWQQPKPTRRTHAVGL